jgi:hypothetical protein
MVGRSCGPGSNMGRLNEGEKGVSPFAISTIRITTNTKRSFTFYECRCDQSNQISVANRYF